MSLSAGRVGVRADQVDSFGRVISPSFLNEIMEDLPEWTDLPVRVNGTEELIPSNPSVPVTSPILADIDYPDVRRNNQYFTYRESPTTVDGLAKIKSIKGNTLVWNQLARKDSASSYVVNVSAVDANGFITVTGTAGSANRSAYLSCDAIVGHKYLVMANSKTIGSTNTGDIVILGNYTDIGNITSTGYMFVDNVSYDYIRFASGVVDGAVYDQKFIPQVFDLTKMFGAGNEPTTVAEFTSLFPLPYYSYDSGSLLSFVGSGIKTTNEGGTEEHTTNLPTETYFPTGMKSAGTVYDELLPTKAVTRIGAVDLGTLNWYYTSGGQGRFATAGISSTVKPVSVNTEVSNIKCVKYPTISAGSVYNGNVGIAIDTSGSIWAHDTAYETDATAFKTAMSGVYLYYELATPVELPTLDFGE